MVFVSGGLHDHSGNPKGLVTRSVQPRILGKVKSVSFVSRRFAQLSIIRPGDILDEPNCLH